MFRVTPVPEGPRDRKVSFSPDIDESYRHQVVDKIQGLMKEVEGIHLSEEKKLKKEQEADAFNFKKKQELELQAFMKRQKEEASGFHTNQTNQWNDLKERHTQETWKLFGRSVARPDTNRPTIHNMWDDTAKKENTSTTSSPCFANNQQGNMWSSRNSQVTSPTSPNSWHSASSNPWEPSTKWDPTGRRSGATNPATPSDNTLDYWNHQ